MMKTITKEVQMIDGEGLEALLGENVILYCINYFYAGKLVGVNEKCVLLEDAEIVYETGALKANTWAEAQSFPYDIYVMIEAIESFGKSGR
jgi:hypothetical protein